MRQGEHSGEAMPGISGALLDEAIRIHPDCRATGAGRQDQALRRQVTRRNQIVHQCGRLKTITQSILQAHLVPQCPHADLFGIRGRSWLMAQHLPPDEHDAIDRHV